MCGDHIFGEVDRGFVHMLRVWVICICVCVYVYVKVDIWVLGLVLENTRLNEKMRWERIKEYLKICCFEYRVGWIDQCKGEDEPACLLVCSLACSLAVNPSTQLRSKVHLSTIAGSCLGVELSS